MSICASGIAWRSGERIPGHERTIPLDPPYWTSDISEIRQLAPHLKPPPAPRLVEPVEASAVEEEDADEEPGLGEAEEDECSDEDAAA